MTLVDGPVWLRGIDDLERLFLDDPELVRAASVFSRARRLVMGGAVPPSLRSDLAPLVDALDRLLGTPHLNARSGGVR